MTFVPPSVHLPTPAQRRAALVRLWDLGVMWGGMGINLEHELKTLEAHERGHRNDSGMDYLCVSGISHPAYMFRAWLEEGTTLVNSLDHLIAYLRARGKLKI